VLGIIRFGAPLHRRDADVHAREWRCRSRLAAR
jgi:hypothetical protein